MSGLFERKILPIAIIYITSLILIYLAILVFKVVKTPIIVALISSAFIIIVLLVIYFLQKLTTPVMSIKDKEAVRYTMFCHNCGWEWMSHTTDKSSPQKCPNCNAFFFPYLSYRSYIHNRTIFYKEYQIKFLKFSEFSNYSFFLLNL